MTATGTIGTDTTTAVVDRYFGIWNTTDADRRSRLIAETWAEDGIYLDPVMRGDGDGGIEAMIAGFHSRFPGIRFHRTAAIDAHNDRHALLLGARRPGRPGDRDGDRCRGGVQR